MRENHIINLLEERPLGSLSVAELDIVKAHIATCSECLRAYVAAQASLLLLQERASVIVEPPPFFQTKVMAAIREQKLAEAARGLEYVADGPAPRRFHGSGPRDASGAHLFYG
jgi:Putative zinc-finger